MTGFGIASLADDWTAEYRGLEIGAPDSAHSFLSIEGLIDAPAVRTADRTALERHGEIAGTDWLGGRTVTLTIEITGRNGPEFNAAVESAVRAFTPAQPDAELTFRFPGVAGGGLRTVVGRVRARTAPVDVAYSLYLATMTVQLYCASPLILDAEEWVASAPLPDPSVTGSGITPPLTFPVTFGAPPPASFVVVTNPGSFDVRPRLRIDGPVSDPTVVNMDTGESITFGITLLAGEWLDVDTESHSTLLNGTAPRFVNPGSDHTWPVCRPGTSRFAYQGARLDPGPMGDGSQLTFTWRPSWV